MISKPARSDTTGVRLRRLFFLPAVVRDHPHHPGGRHHPLRGLLGANYRRREDAIEETLATSMTACPNGVDD